MNEHFERLITRAEALIERIESVLPQPMRQPDWNASIAFRFRKRSGGHGALEPVRKKSKLTFLPFIARALCAAIQAYPRVNATIERSKGGDALVVYRDINLAIAVDLDFEGLMTPVIRGADKMSVPEIYDVNFDYLARKAHEKRGR